MFKRELTAAAGIQVLRNSDRRRLVEALCRNYPESSVQAVLGSKDAKCQSGYLWTHSRHKVRVVFLDSEPVFFEYKPGTGAGVMLVPTVYALWTCRELLKPVVVHRSVLRVLWRGAKLMVPGVMSGLEPGTFAKGELRALYASDDPVHALGVGVVLCNENDVRRGAGAAMELLHHYKDYLWAYGSKKLVPEPHVPAHEEEKDGSDGEQAEEGKGEEDSKKSEEEEHKSEGEGEAAKATAEEGAQETTEGEQKQGAEEEEPKKKKTEQEVMDELVRTTLYRALKTRVAKEELPMLVSTFYSVRMLPCRPAGTVIDIKKSSYKKLAHLLAEAEAAGVLTTETDANGTMKITAVDKAHPLLRAAAAEPVETAEAAAAAEEEGNGAAAAPAQLVSEFLGVTAQTQFAFEAGVKMVTHREAAVALMKYIKEHGLDAAAEGSEASKKSSSTTRLDSNLARLMRAKGTAAAEECDKKAVLDRFVASMTPCYVINREDLPESQRTVAKKAPSVRVTNERHSNKTVTVVAGLESVGIDAEAFAEEIRVVCAGWATTQAQRTGTVVLVGGKAQKRVVEHLTTKYRVPRKYITSPKEKK